MGEEIDYQVREVPVDGYESEMVYGEVTGSAGEGFSRHVVLTNVHVPVEPEPATHVITYDPNGGALEGSSEVVAESHAHGEVIQIREAPVREGYTFTYWKGSKHYPGDQYTVVEDHTFVAQWEKNPVEPERTPSTTPPGNPTTTPNGPTQVGGGQALAHTADGLCPPQLWVAPACLGLALVGLTLRRRRA